MSASSTTTTRPASRLYFWVGLGLVLFALLFSVDLLSRLAAATGVGLRLGGTEGAVRVGLLRVIALTLGLPLLLYRFRATRIGRTLFDASVGIVILVVLLLAIEGLFGWLNRRPSGAPAGPAESLSFSGVYVEPDEALGYRAKAGAVVTATQKIGEQTVYSVTYTINEAGQRAAPVANPSARDKFALFFGGSFTFGDGLNGEETLPAQFGAAAPAYQPYNYGLSGYGPQQMLALVENKNLAAEVSQPAGVAIYTFICPHVNRAIGSMDVVNTWGKVMPYYALNAAGQVERRGDFVSGRPVVATLYRLLDISQTARYFGLTFPRLMERHYELTAHILAAAQQELAHQFSEVDFYVIIYPGQQPCIEQLTPHLERLGVPYFNYAGLFPAGEPGFYIPDGHPTAKAQRTVAERLAQDLEAAE